MALKRQYPHVDQIKDPQIQQAVRLLYDLVYQSLDGVEAVRADIEIQQAIAESTTERLDAVQEEAAAAFALAGKFATPIGTAVGQTGSGDQGDGQGPPQPPGSADAASGCAQAGINGHVLPSAPKNLSTAGMITCGTANEFPALLAAVADLPTREANAVELLGRMIWHLQLAGFPAGRQRNPSGAISKDKLTVQVSAVWHAFDVFIDLDNFAIPMGTQMLEVFPANTVVDGGIPD